MRKCKQVRVLIDAAEFSTVNTILLHQGLGPNYISMPITTVTGTRPTKYAVETLVDRVELAAIKLALKNLLVNKRTIEVERIDRHEPYAKKLDALLTKKHLKRRYPQPKE